MHDPDNHNAVTYHTNMECAPHGVRLTGYVVDDGARHWLWAANEEDAKMLVARALLGDEASDTEIVELYEDECGVAMDEVWVCPLTKETLVGVTFTDDEDGSRRPMAEEMNRNQRRGIVASSEY